MSRIQKTKFEQRRKLRKKVRDIANVDWVVKLHRLFQEMGVTGFHATPARRITMDSVQLAAKEVFKSVTAVNEGRCKVIKFEEDMLVEDTYGKNGEIDCAMEFM